MKNSKHQSHSINEKRNNARIEKWREMLKNNLFSDLPLLKKRTKKGIPSSIRMLIWPQLIKLPQMIQNYPLTYSKILIKDSYDVYDINLDIPRTFSFQSQQILRVSLFNVLKALSIQFPLIGYCQGMNFIAMRLLQILDDEIVFYIIVYILKKHTSIYDNLRNPGFVNRQVEVFNKLFLQYLPNIQQLLKSQGIQPIMYLPAWLLTLFSKSLDKQKFYRFFQCFLLEGYTVLYKTCLALMKFKEKVFLQNQMQQNLLLINNMDFYKNITDDQFINCIYTFQDIKQNQILTIQKEYTYQNKKGLKKLEETIINAYKKKIAEPRNIYQWTIEDYKKVHVNLISFDEE